MAYTFSILLKDLASSSLTKIAKLTNKVGVVGEKSSRKYRGAMEVLPNSIYGLEQKLAKLKHRSERAFTVTNIRKYNGQIRETERRLKRLRNLPPLSMVQRIKQASRNMGSFIGVAGGLYMVRDSFRKMDEQMQAVAQVQAGLASTNGKVGYSLQQLQDKASALQGKTIFGDETILQNTTAQLLTFTNITGSSFEGVQQAVLDVTSRLYGAKASSESLRSTSIMLGKALNDPVANLGALSRSGIQFSESQKEIIKKLAQSGQLAKAQSLIISELNKQYGGSASALAKTGLGPLKQFKNSLGDLQEKLAKGFLPILNSIVHPLKSVADWLNANGTVIEKVTPYVLGFTLSIWGLRKVILGYKATMLLASNATKLWTGVQAVFNSTLWANPITWVVAGVVALIGAIAYVAYKTDGWGKAWGHTVKGAKLLWKAFTLSVKAKWTTLTNGLMIGLNKIKAGWYKFKNAVGLGNSNENAKLLAKIQADTEARKKAIVNARNESLKVAAASIVEFSKAGKSLKWNSNRSLSDISKTIKEKLGIQSPAKAFATGNKLAITKSDNNAPSSLKKATETIAGGGAKQTHINITIQKLQDETKIFVSNAEQGIEDLGDKVQEMLLRAINSANQMQTV